MWWLLCFALLSHPPAQVKVIAGSSPIEGRLQTLPDGTTEVLVPLLDFAHGLGLSASVKGRKGTLVGWRGTLRLRAGSKDATLARKPYPPPLAPVKEGGKLLVPLFSVSRAVRAFAHWDESKTTVWVSPCVVEIKTDFRKEAGEATVLIRLTAPAEAKCTPLEDGRLVVDIFPATYDLPDRSQIRFSAGNFRVRAAQFMSCPDITRVVLDLPHGASAELASPTHSDSFTLKVRGLKPGLEPPSPVIPMQALIKVEVAENSVTLYATGRVEWMATPWRSPLAVAVDLWPAKLAVPPEHPGKGVVRRVRLMELDNPPATVRALIELSSPCFHSLIPSPQGNTLRIVFQPPRRRPPLPSRSLGGRMAQVVVDPGHGGRDPGAIGPSGLQEKDVNLDIALKVAQYLREAGARVVLTRNADFYVSLPARTAMANRLRAKCFVSIHCNAHPVHGSRRGVEVYYYHSHSFALAKAIHDRMVGELGLKDGGIRRRRFYVLRHTAMPSALVEVAYIDHPEEEALLSDPDFRERAARAIADGILDYLLSQ